MSNRILILGSGYVSGAVVNFFTDNPKNYEITVGSVVLKELEDLSKKYGNIQTKVVDINKDHTILQELIQNADIVISLLPNQMHLPVVEKCIQEKVNVVHASYCTPEIMALDTAARNAGIIILNEIGLDPGIDHFLAMKCIDQVHEAGGQVVSFVSYCGGLPAPSCRDNPLQYKFSWSPRTALANLLNGALYMTNNVVVEIPSGGCLIDETKTMDFLPQFRLEGHPNRNSIIYKELYLIPEAQTIIRGTLRYQGFAKAVKCLHQVGLLSTEPFNTEGESSVGHKTTWIQYLASLLKIEKDASANLVRKSLHEILKTERNVNILDSLGLLSDMLIEELQTPIDTLSKYLAETLKFEKGETDIIILRHEMTAEYPNRDSTETKQEFIEVDFIVYGDPIPNGFTAMAKTVGCTLGIASEMILNHEIKATGVIYQFTKDIYDPILKKLEEHGFSFKEKISVN